MEIIFDGIYTLLGCWVIPFNRHGKKEIGVSQSQYKTKTFRVKLNYVNLFMIYYIPLNAK